MKTIDEVREGIAELREEIDTAHVPDGVNAARAAAWIDSLAATLDDALDTIDRALARLRYGVVDE